MAVANNVHWYESMCSVHGIRYTSRQQYWLSTEAMPPFHSNLVTTSGPEDRHAQREAAASLRAELGPGCWSVKDSYNCLKLESLGFSLLFKAQWVCLDGPAVRPDEHAAEITWTVVRTPQELEQWNDVWAGSPDHASVRSGSQFPPALLQNPDLTFLAGRSQDGIVAVAAANSSGRAVGVSNVAARASANGRHWYGCVRAVQQLFPGLVVVGYQSDDDLAAMRRIGFRSLGCLSVWAASG